VGFKGFTFSSETFMMVKGFTWKSETFNLHYQQTPAGQGLQS